MQTSQPRAPFTIVVATDFSKPAQRAFDYALWLAGRLHARLCILYVVMGAWPAGEHEPGSRALRPVKTAALLQLGRLAQRAFKLGIATDPRLEVGSPAERILETCRKMRADLLVVGTYGRGGVARVVLGSVAEELVRAAPCPVMTVNRTVPQRRAPGQYKGAL